MILFEVFLKSIDLIPQQVDSTLMRTFKHEYLKTTLVWVSTLLHQPPQLLNADD